MVTIEELPSYYWYTHLYLIIKIYEDLKKDLIGCEEKLKEEQKNMMKVFSIQMMFIQ